MSVNFPCTIRNSNIALPVQLDVDCLVLLIFIWNNCLFIISSECVSVRIMPYALVIRLVVSKLSLVISSIRKRPSSLNDRVFFPCTDEFHSTLNVSVCSLAFFLSKHPPTRIYIFVSINIGSLTVFYSILPLTYHYYSCTIILTLIFVS